MGQGVLCFETVGQDSKLKIRKTRNRCTCTAQQRDPISGSPDKKFLSRPDCTVIVFIGFSVYELKEKKTPKSEIIRQNISVPNFLSNNFFSTSDNGCRNFPSSYSRQLVRRWQLETPLKKQGKESGLKSNIYRNQSSSIFSVFYSELCATHRLIVYICDQKR